MKIQAVVDEELGERIKTLAAQDGRSVSQWVARVLACWVSGKTDDERRKNLEALGK
ncbi:MAG: hypothetical protein K1Y02_26040 [Candidatus Hydrogenedentes bacterium]|nr:hypothetical protein [Candidatus Hydrogenedentota bacterium]